MMEKDSDRLNRECVDPDSAGSIEEWSSTAKQHISICDAWDNHSRHGYLLLPRQHARVWKYDRLNGSCMDVALSGQVTLIII